MKFSKQVDKNEVISADNVQTMGEITAIKALKVTMAYCGNALDDLYAGLIHDVFDYKPVGEQYSDGYDVAQEAICFLCEHMGERRTDIFTYNKKGRAITIGLECFRIACRYIEKIRNVIRYTRSYNCKIDKDEPSYEMEDREDNEEKVGRLIDKMELSQGEEETLNCSMSGLNYADISRLLKIDRSTIWRRMHRIQRKYLALCSKGR